MNAYDHMTMPYLPPNSNAATDDYLTTLPAMGLSEQSFQTSTYKYPTEEYRGYDFHSKPYTVLHLIQSLPF